MGAASLRKPALASFDFKALCSTSVWGIKGFEIDLTASVKPWYLAAWPALWGSSISAKDCGLPRRERRSTALLFRLEIMDRKAQIAVTMPAKTSRGTMSSIPSTAKNMGNPQGG